MLYSLDGRKFEEAETISSIGVSVDHDIPGVSIIAQPLPRVVPPSGPVEVLVELLPGGTGDHQVAAPGIAGPARPRPVPVGGVGILVTGAAHEEIVTSIVQSHAIYLVVDVPIFSQSVGFSKH